MTPPITRSPQSGPTYTGLRPADRPASPPTPRTPAAPAVVVEPSGAGRTAPLRAPTLGAAAPAGTVRADTLLAESRTRRPYDGSKEATELYESMHGGMFGAGTDEERLLRALDGKTPEQIAGIRKSYRDHYQRDLDADVASELGGGELSRAQALLRGNRAAGDADALHTAMDGAGTDEATIFRTLEGKTGPEREAIQREYKSRHGRELGSDLAGELDGPDLDRARALLSGDTALAEAAKLRGAMAGMGTDEATVLATLDGKSPEQRRAIEQAYQRQYGASLRRDVAGELSGPQAQQAEASLSNNAARTDAARLRTAMEGSGTDEAAIYATLDGKSDAQRQAIQTEYRRQYGRELRADLREELGGNDLGRAEALLARGRLSDAEKLHYAMDGAGTDEATIRQVLGGRSRAEVEGIRTDYRQRYGRSLDDDLKGDLSGRDAFDVSQDLRGAPTSADEAVARLNERQAYERSGILNAPGRLLMDSVNDHGAHLDRNTARANDLLRAARADGTVDAAEAARIAEVTGFATADVGSYREGKDAAGEAVGTAGAVAASVAVVVGTAGTGTPLVMTALGAAAAGGSARVVLSGAVQGQGYGWEAAATDGALGAIDGATAVVGAGTGRAAAGAVINGSRTTAAGLLTRAGVAPTERLVEMTTAEVLERSVARRVAVRATEGAVDGAVGGGLGNGLGTAVRDGTWDDGIGTGLSRMGTATLEGGAIGLGVGGAVGGGIGLRRGRASAFDMVDESKVWVDRKMPNNEWRDWGEYREQLATNRAVETNPPVVTLAGPNGPVDVKVYGTASPRELENVSRSLQRLQDVGAFEALPTEIHLRSRVGQFMDNGRPSGEVAGLGGAGDTMVIARGQAATQHGADHVVHHEVGHNLDGRRGWISGKGNVPFGKGASVSDYGAKNAAEDFAETHRVLVRDWEHIVADPDRYIHHNGDIGAKYRWILENVYNRTIPPPVVPVPPPVP